MHPILERPGRLALYVAAWIPVGVLLAALIKTADAGSWGGALLLALPLAVFYAFLSLGAWFLCRTLPLGRTGASRLLGTLGLAGLLSSALWLLLGRGWAAVVAFISSPAIIPRYRGALPMLFVVGVLLFILSSAFHYLLITFEAARDTERRALALQVLAREAELKALRAQVNPHFLFNSLNSISALVGSDPAAARRMCLLLADFLRRSLGLGGRASVSLREEMTLARSFLAIEEVRFGPRLRLEASIAPDTEDCLVPPLVLQPLVENAVNHGIATLVEGGVVRIGARRTGGLLEITIENPCEPG